jgi:hypothetical protein
MIHYCYFLDLVSSLCAPSHTPSDFSNQEKVLTQDQLAEMPSCNLVESVHNKWLHASGNKGGDLYVATVDDYIRAFLQIVAYYTFLKGGVGGDGPSKEDSNSRVLNVELSVLATPQCCKRSCSTCPVGKSFALAIHTLRAPRCLDRRNEDLTLQLVMMARPTAPIP